MEKRLRLTKNFEFSAVYKKGRRWVCPLFSMYIRKNEKDITRFGISVSKKIGKSVVRNKVKRRIKEVLRRNYYKIKPGYDVVIAARSEVANSDYWEIEKNIKGLLNKAKLWVNIDEDFK